MTRSYGPVRIDVAEYGHELWCGPLYVSWSNGMLHVWVGRRGVHAARGWLKVDLVP